MQLQSYDCNRICNKHTFVTPSCYDTNVYVNSNDCSALESHKSIDGIEAIQPLITSLVRVQKQ